MTCQVCDSSNLNAVLDLGHHPPSDAFLSQENLNEKEVFYPLKVLFCENCKLVQLSYTVDPNVLFTGQYIYRSGFNIPLKKHLQSIAEYLVKGFNLTENDLAVDIGCNDGTLLEGYLPYKVRVLGVDPSKVADVAIEKGIATIKDFFNENLAKQILKIYGKAKAITGTNVFAHVKELSSIVEGVKLLLDDSGVFLTESHYLLDMVTKLQYDAIYLEHLRYYSLESIINLFDHFDMDVIHAERVDAHGGSIRVIACKRGAYPISDSVKMVLKEEATYNLNSIETLTNFGNKVTENRKKLKRLLNEIKANGHKVVGIGAPAKGNTLLNFCKIGPDAIEYLVETNEWKIGKFSPGMHIKIIGESQLIEEQPEYALLLSWNIKDQLIPKLRENGYRGKIIVPNPEPIIVED